MKNVLTSVLVSSWLLTSLPVAAQDEFSSAAACTSKFQGEPYKQPVPIRRLLVNVTYDRTSLWRPSRHALRALIRESVSKELRLQLVDEPCRKAGTAFLKIRYMVRRGEQYFVELDCELSRLDRPGGSAWRNVVTLKKPGDMRVLLKKLVSEYAKQAGHTNWL